MRAIKNIILFGANKLNKLLNPLVIPLYFALFILFGNNVFNTQFLSLQFKLLLVFYIFLFTVALPLLCSLALNRLFSTLVAKDEANSVNISTLSTIICYGLASNFLSDMLGVELAFRFFFYFGVVRLLEWIFVVFIPTIDFYAISMASITTLVSILVIFGYNSSVESLVFFLILSSLLASSRLMLHRATLQITAWSYLLGIGAMLLAISIY